NEATIAAIATPPGPGAIGIVKISGPLAEKIMHRLFRPARTLKSFESHRLYYGWIVDPETDQPVDEVLCVLMRAPHSYTREDVLEIQAHSGYLILSQILELVLKQGARPAEPGEFTRRAYLNGRIDLSQAEAIAEITQARSEKGLSLALSALKGGIAQKAQAIKEALSEALAVIEVAIDFPEEDLEIISNYELRQKIISQAITPIQELLTAYEVTRVFREGISVVIAGRPNVGKSSLLNALLREERAIVSAIPGTTRDLIEGLATIRGIPVNLIDTAGLRVARDEIEEIGVSRAQERIREADLVIFVVDASEGFTPEDQDIYQRIESRTHIVALNKIDIASEERLRSLKEKFYPENLVFISALTGQGLGELTEKIYRSLVSQKEGASLQVVPNIRQKVAFERTLEACQRSLAGLEAQESPEIIAVDLKEALDHLGQITGETTTEEIINRIFDQFCIGK
ncbi:tRNA uridine-5-carboxymethylaminomethyl(34) synthesis GTPase MnmE, partial [Thermosulfuriphilus sp.]